MFIIGIIYGLLTGRCEEISSALLNSPRDALLVFFTIAAMLIFWNGILEICSRSGLLSKLIKPIKIIIHPLFKTLPLKSKAMDYIASNFLCNMLGFGSAATPLGLKAMKELDDYNDHSCVASKEMISLVVINTSGLCLIPSSIIALRQSYGSLNGSNITIYIIIVTLITTAYSIILNEVFKHAL